MVLGGFGDQYLRLGLHNMTTQTHMVIKPDLDHLAGLRKSTMPFERQIVEVKAKETSQFHGPIPEHLREVGCRRVGLSHILFQKTYFLGIVGVIIKTKRM